MSKQSSRGPEFDLEKAIENAGGNRFNLVIMAAARARAIKRQHSSSEKFEHIHTTMTALFEFQDGKFDESYIKRIN